LQAFIAFANEIAYVASRNFVKWEFRLAYVHQLRMSVGTFVCLFMPVQVTVQEQSSTNITQR